MGNAKIIYNKIRNIYFTLIILTATRKSIDIDIVHISYQYFYQYAEIIRIKK